MNNMSNIEMLKSLDFKKMLDLVVRPYSYSDYVNMENKNEINKDKSIYNEYEEIIEKNIKHIYNNDIECSFTKSDNIGSYNRIVINKSAIDVDDNDNEIELYMCPTLKNSYIIINKLMEEAYLGDIVLDLSYTVDSRKDRIKIRIGNKLELKQILEYLSKLEYYNQKLFNNMEKSDAWINKTPIKGVYLGTNNIFKNKYNEYYTSYIARFAVAIREMRSLLLFDLKKNNFDTDITNNEEYYLMNIFRPICISVLGKYGLLSNINNFYKVKTYINNKCPKNSGSINEDINLCNDGLEYGVRLDGNIFRYYLIPIGNKIPNNIIKSNLDYYDMDIIDHAEKVRVKGKCK